MMFIDAIRTKSLNLQTLTPSDRRTCETHPAPLRLEILSDSE